jgi:geranylgeranyl reductase family protein
MRTQKVDILCVGLGPAGARAAAAAADLGFQVLGVDRKREAGLPVQCAEFVPAMLGTEVEAMAGCVRQHIASMETFVESEPADHTAHFPGHMLDRAAFDARLAADAARAGAECVFGTSVRDIGPDGVTVLSDGRRIAARVIIGADGPRSIVGRAIGQVNTALVETRQLTLPLLRPHAATDIFLSAAIPGGYGWLFPKGDVANLGAGVDPAHRSHLKAIVATLHERLAMEGRVGREASAITGGAIPVGGPRVPRGRLRHVGVLLAGDAAGLANPVTGAGIAAAVHSGTLAGEAAAFFLDGHASALEDYHEELDALFGLSLLRALQRREELLRSSRSAASLRRAWIAYSEYWNEAPDTGFSMRRST